MYYYMLIYLREKFPSYAAKNQILALTTEKPFQHT